MRKILLVLVTTTLLCSCYEKTQTKQEEPKTVSVMPNQTLTEWWNYKYTEIPTYKNTKYLANYSVDELLKYYRILAVESYNNKLGYRENKYDELAEKTGLHKDFYDELSQYTGSYYEYLDNTLKEYFLANKVLGIEPNYYSSIHDTAFIGVLTFDCDITINKCKDDKDIQIEIDKKIAYLQNNLPNIIQGFRILSVKYECEKTGTSGSLKIGYLWRRKDNLLRVMDEGRGTYGATLPEKTQHWNQDSWNDNKKLVNSYTID
jgi:hypothetical protein